MMKEGEKNQEERHCRKMIEKYLKLYNPHCIIMFVEMYIFIIFEILNQKAYSCKR